MIKVQYVRLPSFLNVTIKACCFYMLICAGKQANAQYPIGMAPIMGEARDVLQRPDSAFIYWNKQIEAFRQKKDLAGEGKCLQQMGRILYELGNYSEAIEKLLAADKLNRLVKDRKATATNMNLLGTVYYYNQQSARALEQFRGSLAIFSSLDDQLGGRRNGTK